MTCRRVPVEEKVLTGVKWKCQTELKFLLISWYFKEFKCELN